MKQMKKKKTEINNYKQLIHSNIILYITACLHHNIDSFKKLLLWHYAAYMWACECLKRRLLVTDTLYFVT